MFNVGDVVLLMYPDGDVDKVTIKEIIQEFHDFNDYAIVTLPNGNEAASLLDNLIDLNAPDHNEFGDFIDLGGEA